MLDTPEAFAATLTVWLQEDKDYNMMDLDNKLWTMPWWDGWVPSQGKTNVKDEDYNTMDKLDDNYNMMDEDSNMNDEL
jgi:hypothetical protein